MNEQNQPNSTPENESIHPLPHDPNQAEGRRIRGEGLAHEQDFIEERITYGGDTDEYAEAADKLEQISEDIARMPQKPANG
jgi:hypothetical protein